MIAALTEQQIRRYARHLVLGSVGMRGQRRLLGATVRVDLTSAADHVAVAYLAAAGVGSLALGGPIDRPVEDVDLAGAPLLERADVGRPIGSAIAERVFAINPDVEIASAAAGDPPPLSIDSTDDPARALVNGGLAAAAEIARICREGDL